MMIIEISKINFQNIMRNVELDLPKRWDGNDFYNSLCSLYKKYQLILKNYIGSTDLNKVHFICSSLLKCIKYYHNGFPNEAFMQMNLVMRKLMEHPLNVYTKTGWEGAFHGADPLMLYRIRNIQNNINCVRKDIFHTPYNLRSKISSCRYSISGYPCLYLATSLELCCEETKIRSFNDLTIASRYRLERNMNNNEGQVINVIELAVKPKDFIIYQRTNFRNDDENLIISHQRHFSNLDLDDINVMSHYLYWYPLIAACSFIRANKQDPFASEYIIPQLLMQWIRSESINDKLIGIRYFSCASERASELGFNYIFPVSGKRNLHNKQYCKILSRSFTLTKPIYIHEFNSINECEDLLQHSTDFERI